MNNFDWTAFSLKILVKAKMEDLYKALVHKEEFILVELSQKEIPTDEMSNKEIHPGYNLGWPFYLVNLKSVYEDGPDLRNKNSNYKPMVTN